MAKLQIDKTNPGKFKLSPEKVAKLEGLRACTKGLLTISKFSKKKGLNRRTVYNMCEDFRLLSIKIGGVLYIVP